MWFSPSLYRIQLLNSLTLVIYCFWCTPLCFGQASTVEVAQYTWWGPACSYDGRLAYRNSKVEYFWGLPWRLWMGSCTHASWCRAVMSSFLMKREWNYFAGTTKQWKASHQHLMPGYSMQREQPIRLASGQEVKSHNKEGPYTRILGLDMGWMQQEVGASLDYTANRQQSMPGNLFSW